MEEILQVESEEHHPAFTSSHGNFDTSTHCSSLVVNSVYLFSEVKEGFQHDGINGSKKRPTSVNSYPTKLEKLETSQPLKSWISWMSDLYRLKKLSRSTFYSLEWGWLNSRPYTRRDYTRGDLQVPWLKKCLAFMVWMVEHC